MFGRKKTVEKRSYDKVNQKPVVRCSICNGEQVAGFRDLRSGRFEEVMFIRNEADLDLFKKMYDLKSVEKEY